MEGHDFEGGVVSREEDGDVGVIVENGDFVEALHWRMTCFLKINNVFVDKQTKKSMREVT